MLSPLDFILVALAAVAAGAINALAGGPRTQWSGTQSDPNDPDKLSE